MRPRDRAALHALLLSLPTPLGVAVYLAYPWCVHNLPARLWEPWWGAAHAIVMGCALTSSAAVWIALAAVLVGPLSDGEYGEDDATASDGLAVVALALAAVGAVANGTSLFLGF